MTCGRVTIGVPFLRRVGAIGKHDHGMALPFRISGYPFCDLFVSIILCVVVGAAAPATTLFRVLPGLNTGTFLAGTVIVSPVWGPLKSSNEP